MVSDELMKRILWNLSAEGIDRQTRHEYHQGHPTLTEAELDMMVAAEKKEGRPMRTLARAKEILGVPAPEIETESAQRFIAGLSEEGLDQQTKHEIRHGNPHMTEAEVEIMFQAFKKNNRHPAHSLANAKQILGMPEPKPDYSSPWASAMAWAQMYMTAKWEDTELALHASKVERRVLEAIKGLSELPEVEKSNQPPMKFCDWDHRPARADRREGLCRPWSGRSLVHGR